MIDDYTIADFKVGDNVQVFNPRKFGVVDYARVVKVGRKWLHVDFGPLAGGIQRVGPRYVTQNWGAG